MPRGGFIIIGSLLALSCATTAVREPSEPLALPQTALFHPPFMPTSPEAALRLRTESRLARLVADLSAEIISFPAENPARLAVAGALARISEGRLSVIVSNVLPDSPSGGARFLLMRDGSRGTIEVSLGLLAEESASDVDLKGMIVHEMAHAFHFIAETAGMGGGRPPGRTSSRLSELDAAMSEASYLEAMDSRGSPPSGSLAKSLLESFRYDSLVTFAREHLLIDAPIAIGAASFMDGRRDFSGFASWAEETARPLLAAISGPSYPGFGETVSIVTLLALYGEAEAVVKERGGPVGNASIRESLATLASWLAENGERAVAEGRDAGRGLRGTREFSESPRDP